MKGVLFLILAGLCLNSYAVCPKPSKLPEDVKSRAMEKLSVMCPKTYSQDKLKITSWTFSTIANEFSHQLVIQGKTSKFQIEVSGDCSFDEDLFAGKLDINYGCL